MLEILLLVAIGTLVGILFGLMPGLHPNFLIVFAPAVFYFDTGNAAIVFFVSMGVANVLADFIPSILLGAPQDGIELAVSPGHRLLFNGYGYQAIKLAVAGGLISLMILIFLFPLIVFLFPSIYRVAEPFLFFILIGISLYMVFQEKGRRKIISALCFTLSGFLGLQLYSFPLDSSLALFPVLSGLFGAPLLIFQLRNKISKVPKQLPDQYVSKRLITRASLFGSLGGIFSGLLPGVGSSQIASIATIDKNERSFLVTMGALAVSNIIISVISLSLIDKSRSGVALLIENFTNLTQEHMLLILFVALFSAAITAFIVLRISKKFISTLEKINYAFVSKCILIFLVFTVFLFSGFPGLLLFALSSSIGLFAYTSKIRMSVLMGVLLLPTIVFYYPF